MKHLSLGLLVVVALVGVSETAQACAMYRPKQVARPETVVADARAAEARGEPRTALRLLERLMNDPQVKVTQRADAAARAAEIHVKGGDLRLARRRLERAVELEPTKGVRRVALARLVADEDPAAAESALQLALKSPMGRSEKATAHALLAGAQVRLGRLEAADASLAQARRLGAPANEVAAAQRALVLARGQGDALAGL